jgi:hypothetical protein
LEPGDGLVALVGDGRALEAAQALVMSAVVGASGHRRGLVRDARVRVEIPSAGEAVELDPGGGAESRARRRRLRQLVGMDLGGLALLWAGGADRDVGLTVAAGARLLARRSGLARLERGLLALLEVPAVEQALAGVETGPTAHLGEESTGTQAVQLARVEREIRVLRADAAELQGDLDEATMEWLRERQDAETTLMAYRDRARELQARLRQMETGGPDTACLTCGRQLEERFDAVSTELREEWESVVQDGQWWKRRREQLELKPERVRELEGQAHRFHAATEEAAQRAEHLRTALGASTSRRTASDAGGQEPEPPPQELVRAAREITDPVAAALALTDLARELIDGARTRLLSETGKVLNRLSGGRVVGLEVPEGAGGSLVPRPLAGAPGREDVAAARVSAHLALARLLRAGRPPISSLLVGEPFAAMEEEDQIRGVAILRRLADSYPQILVLPAAGVVDTMAEAFDAVWEFRPAPEAGFPALRPLPVGVGTVDVGQV